MKLKSLQYDRHLKNSNNVCFILIMGLPGLESPGFFILLKNRNLQTNLSKWILHGK